MSIDKNRPLKFETPDEGGTQIDYLPTEIDPSEDFVSAKGLTLEDSDIDYIDLSSDNNIQSPTYSSAIFNKNIIPDGSKTYILSENNQYINFDEVFIDGTLTLHGTIVILG